MEDPDGDQYYIKDHHVGKEDYPHGAHQFYTDFWKSTETHQFRVMITKTGEKYKFKRYMVEMLERVRGT